MTSSWLLCCSRPSVIIEGKDKPADVVGGERYDERSFGKGGTGGTSTSSVASPFAARCATRSFNKVASVEWMLEISLLALFRRPLLDE